MSENHVLYDSFGKEEIWEFISRRFTLCFVNCCCKLAAAGKASRRDVLGATSEQVQGLVAQGRTIAETLEIARDVARILLESAKLTIRLKL